MLDNWNERLPNCEPVAYRMKTRFQPRWVRFHCRPRSKRYPENPAEYATVFARQNCILGELAQDEATVVLLSMEYTETPEPLSKRPKLRRLDPNARLWRTLSMHELECDPDYLCFCHVFAGEWTWRPGVFDPILRLIADDAIAHVMIVDPACRWLHHPYDGGMDVILEDTIARDRLKSAHADWWPNNPEGL